LVARKYRENINMEKIFKAIRAILSNFFKKDKEQDWARDQILKMAKLGGRLIL
jgi:hypothetical protein